MIKIILIYTSRAWILCRQAVYHALSWFARRSSQSRTVARNGSIFLSRPLPGIQNERQTSSYETHSPLPSKSCVFKCVSVRRAAHVAAMPAAKPAAAVPIPAPSIRMCDPTRIVECDVGWPLPRASVAAAAMLAGNTRENGESAIARSATDAPRVSTPNAVILI